MNLFDKAIANLHVWDAPFLSYVGASEGMEGGYHFDNNHAFFPLFPFIVNRLGSLFGDQSLLIVNFFYQLLISYLNTILIYRVGIRIFDKARVAEVAAYFHVFGHSTIYQMSFYSENTFLFFSLLAITSLLCLDENILELF